MYVKPTIEDGIDQTQAITRDLLDNLVAEILASQSPPYTLTRGEWCKNAVKHSLDCFDDLRHAVKDIEFSPKSRRHPWKLATEKTTETIKQMIKEMENGLR